MLWDLIIFYINWRVLVSHHPTHNSSSISYAFLIWYPDALCEFTHLHPVPPFLKSLAWLYGVWIQTTVFPRHINGCSLVLIHTLPAPYHQNGWIHTLFLSNWSSIKYLSEFHRSIQSSIMTDAILHDIIALTDILSNWTQTISVIHNSVSIDISSAASGKLSTIPVSAPNSS